MMGPTNEMLSMSACCANSALHASGSTESVGTARSIKWSLFTAGRTRSSKVRRRQCKYIYRKCLLARAVGYTS